METLSDSAPFPMSPRPGGTVVTTSPRHRIRATLRRRSELLAQALVHDLRIRLALGLAHDLAHEEPEQSLLARAVLLHLCFVGGEDPLDHRVELALVGDHGLAHVG